MAANETPESGIRHRPQDGRFVARIDGDEGYLDYEIKTEGEDGMVLDFRSTFVPEEHRGQGIAGRLVRRGLEWAREEGHRVVPSCPFVSRWMDENPEFDDLRA